MIRSPLFDRLPGVVHGFSTKKIEIPFRSSAIPTRAPDWGPVLEALGLPGARVAVAVQVHGRDVLLVDEKVLVATCASPAGPLCPVGQGDALVTAIPGLVLCIRTADCVPVLLAGKGGVAAVHAGWRGTANGVVLAALEVLCRLCGCAPADVSAAVGPAIGPCCYEVGDEVTDAIVEQRGVPREAFLRAGGLGHARPHVDLKAANAWVLQTAGVGAVDVLGLCTHCDERFWSYRRDGVRDGRQAGLIGLRS
jgi:polyphenol oxidase